MRGVRGGDGADADWSRRGEGGRAGDRWAQAAGWVGLWLRVRVGASRRVPGAGGGERGPFPASG